MIELQNQHWQAGLLPQKGGSLTHGRIRYSGTWVDVLRAADPPDYANLSSFLMLPWANRIQDGLLRYQDQSWQLATTKDDHTARHGDVRKRPWQVLDQSETSARLRIESASFEDFNFPFQLAAEATYSLEGADFVWGVTLFNLDSRPFPAGFGFHPYFQHSADNMPLLQVPCDQQFILENAFAQDAPVPISPDLDFREPRAVTGDLQLDHLLTHRVDDSPSRLFYEDWGLEIQIHADPVFQHVLVFTAPDGSLAVEPQTNANDGFNLYADGIPGSGVFEVSPGEHVSGEVHLRIAGA